MFLRNRFIGLFIEGLIAFAASPAPSQSNQALPEHFTAVAITTGGPRTQGGIGAVDITISRWSTPQETERFLNVLRKPGPEALLDELQDAKPVGTIGAPGELAYDLRYAQQEIVDGVRRILLITDRPMSMWEVVNRPLSADYPFTVIELRVDEQGRGDGQVAVAAAITASRNGKLIQLHNYDTQPVQLNDVRRVDR